MSSKKYRSLSSRLLLAVLVSSAIITAIFTLLNLYLDYKLELSEQQSDLKFVEQGLIRSIERSLWILDRVQTEAQLEGILAVPSVYLVTVEDNERKELFSKSKSGRPDSVYQQQYSLYYSENPEKVLVGYLTIYYTRDFIYQKLKTKIISVLISQGIKTFIISFFLLWVFTFLVTRHLTELANYFVRYPNLGDEATPKIVLLRSYKGETEDELDLVEAALNDAIDESKRSVKQIQLLQEAAVRSSRAKGMLIKNISHEMRTPLNLLQGSLELVKDLKGNDITTIYKLQSKSINSLSVLINDLLDLVKIEAQELRVESERIDVQEFLDEIREQTTQLNSDYGGKIDVSVGENLPYAIMGDKTRLKQLLFNVVHFCASRAEVGTTHLEIENFKDQTLRIVIFDDGRYLSEDAASYLLEPFALVSGARTDISKPTALGLNISKSLVEIFGGSITVSKTELGGAKFEIILPLVLPQKSVGAAYKYKYGDELIPAKVLLVEDREENRLLIQAFLAKLPYDVHLASDGRQAVDSFNSEKFDLILMDLNMPVMDGYEATATIRNIEKGKELTRRTHIVALSAYTAKSDVENAFISGVDYYLSKPIGRKVLIEYIQNYMQFKKRSESSPQ